MNIEYLNSLPEIANEHNVKLEDAEKVIFVAKLSTFGTEKDRVLGGYDSKFTLTNKRIIADNNVGTWTIDIASDIVNFKKIESKVLFKKIVYFSVDLNKEVIFGNGEKLIGYHFYLKKDDINRFEEIINNLIK